MIQSIGLCSNASWSSGFQPVCRVAGLADPCCSGQVCSFIVEYVNASSMGLRYNSSSSQRLARPHPEKAAWTCVLGFQNPGRNIETRKIKEMRAASRCSDGSAAVGLTNPMKPFTLQPEPRNCRGLAQLRWQHEQGRGAPHGEGRPLGRRPRL